MVVAHPIAKTPGRPLYILEEAGGSVAGGVLSNVMYASTVFMPPPHPLPLFIPVPLPNIPLPPIPALLTSLPYCCSPGVRPTTRSHSTCEKANFHGRICFEYHYGVKQNINGPNPFLQ